MSYPLQEIISTRETTTEKGRHLDIKVGNLMHHQVVQIYTEQVNHNIIQVIKIGTPVTQAGETV